MMSLKREALAEPPAAAGAVGVAAEVVATALLVGSESTS